MDLILYLNETHSASSTMTAKRFRDERQTNPLVGLIATHRALREQYQMTAVARCIIEQPHQLDAMSGKSVTERASVPPSLNRRLFLPYRTAIDQVQLAEALEILFPFVD